MLLAATLASPVTQAPTPSGPSPTTAGSAPRDATRADNGWHLLVEQDGKVSALSQRPTLKLAPFTLLFTGPASNAYVVLAARSMSALPTAPDFAAIKALVQPHRLVAEQSNRTDHLLLINEDASIASQTANAHLWVEDSARNLHAFLRFEVGPDGRAIAMRPVSSLCRASFRVDRPDCRDLRELAARQAAQPKRPRRGPTNARSADDFAMLVAAIPAGRLTRFDGPRLYEIRFEPAN